jgi:hypothetical protein
VFQVAIPEELTEGSGRAVEWAEPDADAWKRHEPPVSTAEPPGFEEVPAPSALVETPEAPVAPVEEETPEIPEYPAEVASEPGVYETPTTPPAAAPWEAPPGAPMEAPPAPPRIRFGRRDPEERAERLARVLVSDMIAYHPARHREALETGTLAEVFDDEIKKSWGEYVEQIGKELAESTPYFRDALNEILAEGREVF